MSNICQNDKKKSKKFKDEDSSSEYEFEDDGGDLDITLKKELNNLLDEVGTNSRKLRKKGAQGYIILMTFDLK